MQWDKGSIRGLGWSEDERLLVVTEDGTVRSYYDLEGDFTQFSLGFVCTPWQGYASRRLSNEGLGG